MFGRFGRSSGEIFTTGPTITNDQSGRISRHLVEQLGIEALVDHAVEAEARPRQVFLVGRLELPRAGLEKWARSTDDGKQWTLWWRSFFASYRLDPPVKTMSARSISSCSSSSSLTGANWNLDSSSIAS